MPGKRWAVAALMASAAVSVASTAPAGASSKLPNACAILSAAAPQNTIGKGTHASAGHYTPSNGPTYSGCAVKVGTITVSIYLEAFAGGSGGVRITSITHPPGFGGTATLVVGVGAGKPTPVDYITFHKPGVYASLNANGAEPSDLTALARVVYPKI